jgi:hypothetical protein
MKTMLVALFVLSVNLAPALTKKSPKDSAKRDAKLGVGRNEVLLLF